MWRGWGFSKLRTSKMCKILDVRKVGRTPGYGLTLFIKSVVMAGSWVVITVLLSAMQAPFCYFTFYQ